MTVQVVVQVVQAVLLLSGAVLTLLAAVGLLRLPDVLARSQAATKPQLVGLVLIILGVALAVGEPDESLALILVALFQLATAPVLAQLVGRAAYRAHAIRHEALLTDDLATALTSRRPDRDPHPDEGPDRGRG